MRSERGGVLVFFGLVLAFVVLALLVVVQIIRYGLAVADLQAAADAAAEAAVSAVDIPTLEETGEIWFSGTGDVDGLATAYANANSTYLAPKGYPITCAVVNIDDADDTVTVACSATVSELLGRSRTLTRWATAKARPLTFGP